MCAFSDTEDEKRTTGFFDFMPSLITNSSGEVTLALESASQNPIDNGQFTEISLQEISAFQATQEKRFSNVVPRGSFTSRYNCHGMTFACRRTGIYDPSTIQQILKEDNYVEIPSDKVLPGDVIIYYASNGDAEHSGVVVTEPQPPLRISKVVSKWGRYKEIIHWANDCPYSMSNIKYYRVSLQT